MMPALSPTMEKGTLAKWLVAVGDAVRPGDLLAEIETDKATMEFEAADGGRVAELVVPEGTDDVPVGTVIARLSDGDAGAEAASATVAVDPDREPGKAGEPQPGIVVDRTASAEDLPPRPAGRDGERADGDRGEGHVGGTPSLLARKVALANGVDLSMVAGTGSGGRIVVGDLGTAGRPAAPTRPGAAPTQIELRSGLEAPGPASAPPPHGIPVETVKLSTMRRTIARRLSESKRTVPHFYLSVRCDLDRLLSLRTELNVELERRGVKLSINDMLMKAMASALAEVPDANVQFGEDRLHRFGRVDLSVAVAIDGGLVTPVVRDVVALSLSALSERVRELADRARAGKLSPTDYEGGTASISNLGMFGIDEMVPVINPPQALILGIGAGVEQPWKVNGAVGLATIMTATASFDHRAIDGAVAARFISAFRAFVEDPWLICC